jgi:hypothetical protein
VCVPARAYTCVHCTTVHARVLARTCTRTHTVTRTLRHTHTHTRTHAPPPYTCVHVNAQACVCSGSCRCDAGRGRNAEPIGLAGKATERSRRKSEMEGSPGAEGSLRLGRKGGGRKPALGCSKGRAGTFASQCCASSSWRPSLRYRFASPLSQTPCRPPVALAGRLYRTRAVPGESR